MLETGEPLELYPEQRTMLGDYFDGARETLILISKKNGKSSLLAALALWHLVTTTDAACYIGASSRDQATILYEQACGYVRRSPILGQYVNVKRGYRELRSASDAGHIRVLAADADTADGVIPTLGLVDELHRQKSSDLYGVFRDGLGARNGQMITISTAGDDEDSPLGRLRAEALAREGLERTGVYRHVRDAGFALHEWALEIGEDQDDLNLVKQANPAPWQTLETLRERHDSPSMTPWQWARFACGVWGVGDEPYFDIDVWNELAADGDEIKPGRLITLGFDGARRHDATAIVATDVESGHQQLIGAWERPPHAADDWEIDEGEVDEVMAYAFKRWKVWRLYGDPPYWESALDRWAGEYGSQRVVRWWTNRLKATALALLAWRNDMRPGVLSHDGDPLLARHIGNAVRKNTRMREGDQELAVIRKDGPKSPRKIDAAMAGCLSWKARGDAIETGALNEPTHATAGF